MMNGKLIKSLLRFDQICYNFIIIILCERNIGDQRLLEYKCSELNKNVTILRHSLTNIIMLGRLDGDNKRLYM